jgi:cytosine/adenosine deaminase-related metal-dependent hydrolase
LRYNFPVRVVKHYRWSHSLLLDGDAVEHAYRRAPKKWPWMIHLAEGTDLEAAAELERLERLHCLGANTVIVHGVGLREIDQTKLIEKGGALIWCPSSNYFMLGRTAKVKAFVDAKRVALGSDSRLSGDRDLLAELNVAHQTKQVKANELFHMVTSDAASILRLPHAGKIKKGFPADLVIFPLKVPQPFENIVTACRADLRLVMISGRPVIGDSDLAPVFAATRVNVKKVRVDGRDKLLAQSIISRLQKSAVNEPGLEI